MTKQFLNGSNVVAVFKKMCCKGMSEGVTTGVLIYSGFKNCLFYGFLQQGFIQMPAAFFSCFFVFPSVCLREQPLPFKLFGRRRIFFIQLISQKDLSVMLNKGYNYINSIEGGVSFPPPQVIDEIASFLHIEPEILFSKNACPKNINSSFKKKYSASLAATLISRVSAEIEKVCRDLLEK